MRNIGRNVKTGLLFITVFLFFGTAQATHIMGLDLTYECIGGNTYEFTLKFFRACEDGSFSEGESYVLDAYCFSSDTILTTDSTLNRSNPSCDSTLINCSINFNDQSSNLISNEVTSVSYTHTTSGINRILFVSVATTASGTPSVTYSAQPLSLVTSTGTITVDDDEAYKMHLYYILNPSSGTNNIEITGNTGDYTTGAVSYTCIDQNAPFTLAIENSGSQANISENFNTSTDQMLLDFLFSSSPFVNEGNNQELRMETQWNANIYSSEQQASSPTTTMEWNNPASSNYHYIGLILNQGNPYSYSQECYTVTTDTIVPDNDTIISQSSVTLSKVSDNTISGIDITPICSTQPSPCPDGIPGGITGVEQWVYKGTMDLNEMCGQWKFGIQMQNRNLGINTINSPGGEAAFVQATLKPRQLCNNSPIFTNPPVAYMYTEDTFCYNHGAIDPDGDSLSYELYTPKTNENDGDTVTYLPGYFANDPFGGNTMNFNPKNGDFCVAPESPLITVMAIRVNEWRNGVKIGSVERDIQLVALESTGNKLPDISGTDSTDSRTIDICVGEKIDFSIYAHDPDGDSAIINWNGGIPAGTFTIDKSKGHQVGYFSWTPTPADASTTPYSFTVTVRDTACPLNGLQTRSFNLYVRCCFNSDFNYINQSCGQTNNGSATVIPGSTDGPFKFNWNTGATTQTISNLSPGQYWVTTTDSKNCISRDTVTISSDGTLNISSSVSNVRCKGEGSGAIDLSVSGGRSPYSFQWSPNTSDTTEDVAGLIAGTYNVTVLDQNLCGEVLTFEVEEPSDSAGKLSFYVTTTPVKCVGDTNTGTAMVHATGGWGNYKYKWSTGDTTKTIEELTAGEYFVTVIDSGGCSLTNQDDGGNSIIIDSLPSDADPLTFYVTETPVKCKDDSATGTATAHASGGHGNYTYRWSNNDTTKTITGLSEGVYYVTVIDAEGGGCVLTSDDVGDSAVIVTVPIDSSSLSLYITETPVKCKDDSATGTATAHASGGHGDYTYLWSNSDTTQTITGLSEGIYYVTVIDAGGEGCVLTSDDVGDSAVIRKLPPNAEPLSFTLNHTNAICGEDNGTATAHARGGWGDYTYIWSNNQTYSTANDLASGNYCVTVIDAGGGGCAIDNNGNNCVTVIALEEPFINAEPEEIQVGRGAKVPVEVNANGIFTYSWIPSTGLNCFDCQNPVASPPESTLYTVSATDSNGCVVTDSVLIRISGKIEIYIPNTFTPNGDNVNDKVKVEGFGIKRLIAFRVFNRWGQLVFETSDQDESWDGTFKGQPLDMDRYVYYVIIETYEGQEVTRQGGITLVR